MAGENLLQELAQRQALIASSCGRDGKGAPILMGLADVNCGANLSLKGKGLNADKTAPTLVAAGKPGISAKIAGALAAMSDELKKINQNGSAIYAGQITTGTTVSSGLQSGNGNGTYLS